MPKTWATFGVDLHLDVTGTRVRAALEHGLRDAVRTGRLHPGTRLPSSRALASDMEIARNTVADAYGQLVAEGWLTAQPGSGTCVADRAVATADSPRTADEPATRPARYDLRAGSPDLNGFPRTAWLRAARQALTVAPDEAFGYGDVRGRPELRHALAEYLSRARGVHTDAERIVVCSGFTQALALLCRALAIRGASSLAVEAYGQQSHRQIVAASGLNVSTVSVNSRGAAISELGDADAVVLTPAHQFPLGVALAPQRRTQAIQWAVDTAGVVIEDDYDGEFRYDRQPLGALQALGPEHVAYVGTASKSLGPGLRLGWLVLPAQLIDDVAAAKMLADRSSSTLDQLILAELITSGAYDHHVRRSRIAYRRRRDRLVAALHQKAPHVRITGIAAGLHALVELPIGHDEDEIVATAARHDLAVEALGAYRGDGHTHGPALVVGYGTPPEHAFRSAVARLCAVLTAAHVDRVEPAPEPSRTPRVS